MLLRQMFSSHRKQSIDLNRKPIDWLLYDAVSPLSRLGYKNLSSLTHFVNNKREIKYVLEHITRTEDVMHWAQSTFDVD